jgi:hypothetical protein
MRHVAGACRHGTVCRQVGISELTLYLPLEEGLRRHAPSEARAVKQLRDENTNPT